MGSSEFLCGTRGVRVNMVRIRWELTGEFSDWVSSCLTTAEKAQCVELVGK